MADKNAKANIKVIEAMAEDKKDSEEIIKELEEKIASMKKDKVAKCKAAKEQLIEMLQVTEDKYKTATGTAEALRVLRFVAGDDVTFTIAEANSLAWKMAGEVHSMIAKANSLNYDKMDMLCEDFYDKEFSIKADETYVLKPEFKLATEMMRIDLCRNVGGAAEDMASFVKRVQEEIDATGEELKELKAKEA